VGEDALEVDLGGTAAGAGVVGRSTGTVRLWWWRWCAACALMPRVSLLLRWRAGRWEEESQEEEGGRAITPSNSKCPAKKKQESYRLPV
jgi:hypothetical protein